MFKTFLLLIFLFAFIGLSPTMASSSPDRIPTEHELAPNDEPKAPEFDPALPSAMFYLGLFIAGVSFLNPWVLLGIGIGVIIIALVLFSLFSLDDVMPKGKQGVAKVIGVIFGLLLGLCLLALFIVALVLGMALLIAAILGATANPVLGGLAIAAIGAVWYIAHVIRYWIRKRRYRKAIEAGTERA